SYSAARPTACAAAAAPPPSLHQVQSAKSVSVGDMVHVAYGWSNCTLDEAVANKDAILCMCLYDKLTEMPVPTKEEIRLEMDQLVASFETRQFPSYKVYGKCEECEVCTESASSVEMVALMRCGHATCCRACAEKMQK